MAIGKEVKTKIEWKRINKILKSISNKVPISLDTRKSEIMEKGINLVLTTPLRLLYHTYRLGRIP